MTLSIVCVIEHSKTIIAKVAVAKAMASEGGAWLTMLELISKNNTTLF